MPIINRLYFQVLKLQRIVIVFTALALMSCRELVQDEFPDFTAVPTVNSILIADSTLKVYVSLAAKMDTIPLQNVDQADVQLYVDGVFSETLVSGDDGLYTSTSIVETGKSYQCRVTVDGYDTLTCSDSLPIPNPVLSIEHINVAGKDEEGNTYPAIRFSFANNPLERRYYEVIIRYNRYSNWRMAQLKEITDPVLLAEGLPLTVFSNERITGDTYSMLINYSTGSYSCQNDVCKMSLYPFVLEFRSISYDYYRYLKQLYLYNTGRYPDFTSGVLSTFPLHSNVKNGYGIFAGYSSFVSDLIKPE